jgi:hypothetical protein
MQNKKCDAKLSDFLKAKYIVTLALKQKMCSEMMKKIYVEGKQNGDENLAIFSFEAKKCFFVSL